MRLNHQQHLQRPYRLRALASDFELIDLWVFPISASPEQGEDFELFLKAFHSSGFEEGGSRASTLLFWLREQLGGLFGWDAETNTLPIPGCSETSLRQRLTAEEQRAQEWFEQPDTAHPTIAFRQVYRSERESVLELSNSTVHAALQLCWVTLPSGMARPELAVYVKQRGRFGRGYMALIKPFRHWVVYPALLRQVKRRWEELLSVNSRLRD